MANGKVVIDASGFEVLSAALRKVPKEMRTEVNGPIRQAAKEVASQIVIPQLRRAAGSGPPQARITAQPARPRSDRWPKVIIGGLSSNFRPPRSPGDSPRYGAIFWGSVKGGSSRFGSRQGDLWVGPAIKSAGPRAVQVHQKYLTQLLAKEGLL